MTNSNLSPVPEKEPLFLLDDLWKSRFDGKNRVNVLEGVSASVEAGRIVTVVGPSGSGKSTLMLLLNRLEEPDSGRITYLGRDLREWNVLDLRRQVGMVFQQPVMLSGSVRENVLYGPRLVGEERDSDPEALLGRVGLDPSLADRDARELSGGQQQRVALARVLANYPAVLLLDEPTSALDENASRMIEELVVGLQREKGLTCIWVTHDLSQALRLDGETWVFDSGRLVESGSTMEVLSQPRHPAAREYLKSRLERGEAR